MPRFVVLLHQMPATADRGTHWDLMLERQSGLQTWALTEEPAAGREIEAAALAEHRLDYLEYEGPISGNRGDVSRWDAGTFEFSTDAPDEVQVKLHGAKLNGNAILRRTAGDAQRWTFSFSA
ncbi:MAG TPA: DNA polymerase ligase N-terminal domain-containing protein [Pirellulales bacterium]